MHSNAEDNVLDEASNETVDVEEFTRAGKNPPHAKFYRFKVNGTSITVDHPIVTGREVLLEAGLKPPEKYTLRVKIAGQKPRKVELDDPVDLRTPGIEKFKALPKDQDEGDGTPLRRKFDLPAEDRQFLDDYGCRWETIIDRSHWLLLHNFLAPEGYNYRSITIAIRIATGYPDAPLDMVYVSPALKRLDGKTIGATTGAEVIDGVIYQQWSRHRSKEHPWIIGQDNIGTHIILVEEWFAREFL